MKGLTYIAGVILGVVAFVTAVSVFVWHWTLPEEDLVVADAASIAGLLLTTDCMVTDIPEKKESCSCGGHGQGGMNGMM